MVRNRSQMVTDKSTDPKTLNTECPRNRIRVNTVGIKLYGTVVHRVRAASPPPATGRRLGKRWLSNSQDVRRKLVSIV
jgi:hypothetical protein